MSCVVTLVDLQYVMCSDTGRLTVCHCVVTLVDLHYVMCSDTGRLTLCHV